MQQSHKDKWGIIKDRKNVRPHTKGMIEAVDRSLGKIVKAITDLGLEENTLIVFTSDNGGYLNYTTAFENISSNGVLRGQKGTIYEGGHRVPFIISWPNKIKPGVVSDELVMTMDMFPTLLALTSTDISLPPLDGTNVLPVFLENRTLPERAVFWKIGNEKAIRRGQWKIIMSNDDLTELYNLSNDVGETIDRSATKKELVEQMKLQYHIWEKDVTANYKNN